MSDVAGAVDVGATATTTETPPAFDDILQSEINRLFDAADQQERRTEQVSGQARGPDGKFQASDAGKTEQAQPNANVGQEIPEPPESWSTVKAHWSVLPPEVRQALIDRDATDEKSRTEFGERLKGYESLERIIGPRRDALTKGFTSAEAAIEQLFALSDFAGRDFPGFVRWMCQQRNVDPRSLIEQVTAQATTDPTIAALHRRNDDLEKRLNEREQAEKEERDRKALAEIDTFKASKSDKGELLYPHFEALKQAMGKLLNAGAAESLAQAYKIALAADEKLQAKIAKEAEDARKKAETDEAKEKAAKAQRAARADIRSGSGSTSAARASLEDDLKANIDKAFAGAAA